MIEIATMTNDECSILLALYALGETYNQSSIDDISAMLAEHVDGYEDLPQPEKLGYVLRLAVAAITELT